jgi:alpha-tubulin suppressor-like RCC1 family protein
MMYRQLQTIGFIFCVALVGACTPADSDVDRATRDAASTPDAGVDASRDAQDPETGDVGPPAVAAIEISPANPTIELNATLKLEAIVFDADGAELVGHGAVWSSSDPAIVSVNEYANIIGRDIGVATITATIDGVSGSTIVTVTGKPVETVKVVPAQRTLQISEQVELSVFLEDSNQQPIDDERDVEFSSSAPGVATVSDAGLVTGVSAGSATVTATAEGRSDTAAITVEATTTTIERVEVTPASARLIRGDTSQLQVAVYEAGNSEVTDPSVTWTSSAPDVATVDASGQVEAIDEGSATIIASSGGVSDTAEIDVVFSVEALERGGSHSCGIVDGAVFCWGANDDGQLGLGNTSASAPVGRVSGAQPFDAAEIVELALGDAHTCALTSSGEAYCWGANDDGQLGDATNTERHVPTQVSGGRTYTDIAAGGAHTCAVDNQGTSWCWGANGYGQLGAGTTSESDVPVQVSGPGFASIFAGDDHTCAVTSTGAASCWGRNHRGQLGVDDTDDRHSPAQVLGGYEFVALSLGQAHTCGTATAGSTACWGANDAGQIGDGTTSERHTPILVSGAVSFSRLGSGDEHTCGLAPGGTIYCWGANGADQLGLGATGNRHQPTAVSSTVTFSDVHTGGDGTCALDIAGKSYCWGAPSGNQSPTLVGGF